MSAQLSLLPIEALVVLRNHLSLGAMVALSTVNSRLHRVFAPPSTVLVQFTHSLEHSNAEVFLYYHSSSGRHNNGNSVKGDVMVWQEILPLHALSHPWDLSYTRPKYQEIVSCFEHNLQYLYIMKRDDAIRYRAPPQPELKAIERRVVMLPVVNVHVPLNKVSKVRRALFP